MPRYFGIMVTILRYIMSKTYISNVINITKRRRLDAGLAEPRLLTGREGVAPRRPAVVAFGIEHT